ncbi:TPA: hypothetical protein ACQUHH_005527 [Bacillus mobilis]
MNNSEELYKPVIPQWVADILVKKREVTHMQQLVIEKSGMNGNIDTQGN